MKWLKWFRRVGGTALFVAGAFSLLLPVVPGVLLIVIGLYLLSIDSPRMQRRCTRIFARYPVLARVCRPHWLLGRAPPSDTE
jgi:uncharacterized protein YqgC (DUF456 family)